MTQYDRLISGQATATQIADEIKATAANKPLWRKLPGHVMVEDFLVPNQLDIRDVSRIAKIPPRKIHSFIRGECKVDDFLAGKLGYMFNTGKNYWLDLQAQFDAKGTL